jgi:hypothetical protein
VHVFVQQADDAVAQRLRAQASAQTRCGNYADAILIYDEAIAVSPTGTQVTDRCNSTLTSVQDPASKSLQPYSMHLL